MKIRVGQGYDVHQLVSGRPLILGGVTIAHDKGLLGHSDADALLHAITDALLGAAALGDIGHHFPDTATEFKGADSRVLLRVMGNAGQANYAAAKAGCIGFTKSVAKEVAARGITVNGVAPGFIKTDMTSVLPEKVVADMEAGIPLARLGEPEDIAKAVLFLVSDDAAYITGQTLHVDGGMVM